MKPIPHFLTVIFIFLSSISRADITLPHIFSSDMVLQRNREIPVWGWADPGERVSVTINGHTESIPTNHDGSWTLQLSPMKEGGPYEMIFKGKNEIILRNVMLGDVWICSGQSNMEWPVSRTMNAEEEIADASYPLIRIFTVPNKISARPLNNTDPAEWQICSPENIPSFSAVGYFFGRELNNELNIPVGLINTTWGGTVAESWSSAKVISEDPDFSDLLIELRDLDINRTNEEREKEMENWLNLLHDEDAGFQDGKFIWSRPETDFSNWKTMELPSLWEDQGLEGIDGVVWFARTVELPASVAQAGMEINLGPIDDSDKTWVNGELVGEIFNHYSWNRKYNVEAGNLKTGENVVVVRVEDYSGGGGIYGDPEQLYVKSGTFRRSLAGEWKYRVGSSELPSEPPKTSLGPNSYPTLLFNAMINPIIPYAIKGAIWYQGESNAGRAYQYRRIFPQMIKDWRMHWDQGDFPFLYVQLANFMEPKEQPGESAWAELREAQTMTLSLVNTGMASAIDIGEADDIHPRNKQEVGRRLALSAFGVAYDMDVVHSGPSFKSMKIDGDKVYITFNNTGSGLVIDDPYGYLKGFTIAGEDRKFHWARAETVDENTVVVYTEEEEAPVAVRYGWADNPHDLNLYNSEGLPANPFRTDTWPGITQK